MNEDGEGANEAELGASRDAEIASLGERLERTEQYMAQTLMRATRLAQVISVLGNERDLETTVERAATEVGELFFADLAVLILTYVFPTVVFHKSRVRHDNPHSSLL